jgi:hypothetical protein
MANAPSGVMDTSPSSPVTVELTSLDPPTASASSSRKKKTPVISGEKDKTRAIYRNFFGAARVYMRDGFELNDPATPACAKELLSPLKCIPIDLLAHVFILFTQV